MVLLKRNYRFKADSGIGLLATAINRGDGRQALDLLDDARLSGISWRSAPPPDQLKSFIKEQILDGYSYYLKAETVEEALSRFDSFRLLSALREGPFGVTGITALVEEILSEHGLINRCSRFYKGRPVVVTANDYGMKLFNGDIGLIFPDEDGRPKACFPDPGGGVRWISPYRLPEHETVFAMTVHKSQGSEFDDILMFLPDHAASLLSRELIYTGITRARKSVSIIGERELFVAAAARRIERKSGLEDALWNTGC
jgi:exodeoxyribonuclease V alpha subunit